MRNVGFSLALIFIGLALMLIAKSFPESKKEAPVENVPQQAQESEPISVQVDNGMDSLNANLDFYEFLQFAREHLEDYEKTGEKIHAYLASMSTSVAYERAQDLQDRQKIREVTEWMIELRNRVTERMEQK